MARNENVLGFFDFNPQNDSELNVFLNLISEELTCLKVMMTPQPPHKPFDVQY
jgi:hypothetical protein